MQQPCSPRARAWLSVTWFNKVRVVSTQYLRVCIFLGGQLSWLSWLFYSSYMHLISTHYIHIVGALRSNCRWLIYRRRGPMYALLPQSDNIYCATRFPGHLACPDCSTLTSACHKSLLHKSLAVMFWDGSGGMLFTYRSLLKMTHDIGLFCVGL